jgi:hypothetical protein
MAQKSQSLMWRAAALPGLYQIPEPVGNHTGKFTDNIAF